MIAFAFTLAQHVKNLQKNVIPAINHGYIINKTSLVNVHNNILIVATIRNA